MPPKLSCLPHSRTLQSIFCNHSRLQLIKRECKSKQLRITQRSFSPSEIITFAEIPYPPPPLPSLHLRNWQFSPRKTYSTFAERKYTIKAKPTSLDFLHFEKRIFKLKKVLIVIRSIISLRQIWTKGAVVELRDHNTGGRKLARYC